MLTKTEMIRKLEAGDVRFPPLDLRLKRVSSRVGNQEIDAIVEAWWDGQLLSTFAVEYKSAGTPKALQSALFQVKGWNLSGELQPMVMVPYLSEERLKEFATERVSAIDLCGNGVILVDRRLFVYRTGGQNQFKSPSAIKNIYRRKSSLVPRVFLAKPRFHAVREILEEVNARNRLAQQWVAKAMSLSTVSKALKVMAEDLLIQRQDCIDLVQPGKLLGLLNENYDPPDASNRIRLKLTVPDSEVLRRVREEASRLSMPWVVTGLSSVSRYAVMQRGEMISIYCPQLRYLLSGLGGRETNRFPNLELIECDDERVYFDSVEENGVFWADATQTYLELMAGDKRDRETAQQVESCILRISERER